MLKSQLPVPVDMTSFGNRVFAEVLKLRWGQISVGPKHSNWYPDKEEKFGDSNPEETPSGEGYVMRGQRSEFFDLQPKSTKDC